MEPRRSKGKKWTALPKDYVKQVVDALRESFADEVKSGKFLLEGRIYPDELLVRMGYLEKGRLRQTNFELSADYKAGKDDTLKILNLCMDVGATMLEELFAATSDEDFPRVWTPFEVEGRLIHIQFTANNSELDEKADLILGEDAKNLVADSSGDDDPEELRAIKAKLGLDEDDESSDE